MKKVGQSRRGNGAVRRPLFVLVPIIAVTLGALLALAFGPQGVVERITLGIATAVLVLSLVFYLILYVVRDADLRSRRLNTLVGTVARSRRDLARGFEQERHRLRRDLHDSLGPLLATSVMRIDSVRRLVDRDPASVDSALVELREETQVALGQIRRLIYELRPSRVQPQGLFTALQVQADRFNRASLGGLTVTLHVTGDPSILHADVATAAFRIASEALTNVVRHADASECDITVTVTDRLIVEVIDNGVGLDPCNSRGLGLRSIQERADELGGRCRFRSLRPHGTSVWINVPLSTNEAIMHGSRDS